MLQILIFILVCVCVCGALFLFVVLDFICHHVFASWAFFYPANMRTIIPTGDVAAALRAPCCAPFR